MKKKGKLIWKEAKIKEKERRMVNENDIINENVKGKRKRSEDDSDEELTIKKQKISNKNTGGHIIKYSGEEYKSKHGKGDILIKGKAEPFAYIQLNTKTTSKKYRKEGLKTFKNIMKKEGKNSIIRGLKIKK